MSTQDKTKLGLRHRLLYDGIVFSKPKLTTAAQRNVTGVGNVNGRGYRRQKGL